MGVRIKTAESYDKPSSAETDEETSRQTYWSCYLLDVQFSLGEHRSKLLQNTKDSPCLPSTEDYFMRYPSLLTYLDESLQIDNMLQQPDYHCRQMSTDSYGLLSTSPFRMTASVHSFSTGPTSAHPGGQGDNIFGHYVHSLSILGRVHLRGQIQRRRCVLYILPRAPLY